MDEWRIERLNRSHRRGEFSCGREPLDAFLRTPVGQYEKRNLGRTCVATLPDEVRVLGYYTLASGVIPLRHLPESAANKLPRHPAPTVLLARLAADQSVQGRGLGAALLVDALRRSNGLAEALGIHAVEVDAIDEPARTFYGKYGFLSLTDEPFHLYLPIGSIRRLSGLP